MSSSVIYYQIFAMFFTGYHFLSVDPSQLANCGLCPKRAACFFVFFVQFIAEDKTRPRQYTKQLIGPATHVGAFEGNELKTNP